MITRIFNSFRALFPAAQAPYPSINWDREIELKCLAALNKPGFEEDAVIRSHKILEERLRNLLGASPEKTGTQLAQEAFGENGRLKIGKTKAEQLGLQNLYSGVFLFARNASGHRFVKYSPDSAFSSIVFINQLVRWLEIDSETASAELGFKSEQCRFFLSDVNGDGQKERVVLVQLVEEFLSYCSLLVLESRNSTEIKKHALVDSAHSESADCEIRDINHDGKKEIILRWRIGRTRWLRAWHWANDQFVDITNGGIHSDAADILMKDVDGDGREEIVVRRLKAAVPETRHSVDVLTFHWNGERYHEGVIFTERFSPTTEALSEDQIISMILDYEPAARRHIEETPGEPGVHTSWRINRNEDKKTFTAQLVWSHDADPLSHTFNHYRGDLETRQVKSMLYHHPDGSVTMMDEWP